MKLTPQDENGIVAVMLRDIENILRENENFDFSLANRVKTTKIIFSLVEQLDIPVTRSWYRHGGYLHNNVIKLNDLSSDYKTIIGVTEAQIQAAEQLLKEFQKEYETLLHQLVPQFYFMSRTNLLKMIYQNAPEPYRPLYMANLRIEEIFHSYMTIKSDGSHSVQQVISQFAESGKLDFGYYRTFSPILSKLSLEICTHDNFARIIPFTQRYIDLFEDYLVKASFEGVLSPILINFENTYKNAIWNIVALVISLNTTVGVRYDEVTHETNSRLIQTIPKVDYQLRELREQMERCNLLLALEERKRFFDSVYSKDKDVLGAIANVWNRFNE